MTVSMLDMISADSSKTPGSKRAAESLIPPSVSPTTSSPNGPPSTSKRRRLSPRDPRLTPAPTLLPDIPLQAILYHLATSAHHTAHHHLQQAYVPLSVSPDTDGLHASLSIPSRIPNTPPRPFTHDPRAASKVFGLYLLALQLLRSALAIGNISDKEKVAFGLEFGLIGVKAVLARPSKDKENRLAGEIQEVVGQASLRQQLEVLNARLAFMLGKSNHGFRLAKQALQTTGSDDVAHRYTLLLFLLEHAAQSNQADFLGTANALENEAKSRSHPQMVQLVHMAKLAYFFSHRRWDMVPSALQDCADSIGWSDEGEARVTNDWVATFTIQYLQIRALWEGRIGNDVVAKRVIRKIYIVMDDATDRGIFLSLRATAGATTIRLPVTPTSPLPDQTLCIQLTPPNVVYLLTYLTTVTARRDIVGLDAACASLIHPRAMRENMYSVRTEDMWDVTCGSEEAAPQLTIVSPSHGLHTATQIRKQVAQILAEIMIEEASALVLRSNLSAADTLLCEIIDLARTHRIIDSLVPHLCIVRAQYAHLLGNVAAASRYYEACRASILPGSELGIIIDICQLAAEGSLVGLLDGQDHMRQDEVTSLSEKSRQTSNANLQAAGYFLASLTDPNRATSKKKLSTAYEIAHKANNNILRGLIFAFTTSVHLYGGRDRTLLQLETGRELAQLIGGKDRADGVGQVSLGLWFLVKLKGGITTCQAECIMLTSHGNYSDQYRQDDDQQRMAVARQGILAHLTRLDELSHHGLGRSGDGRKRGEGSGGSNLV
ncbi:hypothetical protein P7C73_g4969, partial [Tremellales sp. Uapishka_1]